MFDYYKEIVRVAAMKYGGQCLLRVVLSLNIPGFHPIFLDFLRYFLLLLFEQEILSVCVLLRVVAGSSGLVANNLLLNVGNIFSTKVWIPIG